MKAPKGVGIAVILAIATLAWGQADTAKPKRLRVSSGVAEGLKVHDVPPAYPPEARKQGIEGDVLLRVIIAHDGSIQDMKVVEGEPILAEAAMEAVKQWKYRPYLLNGEPVEVETMVTVRFHLGKSHS